VCDEIQVSTSDKVAQFGSSTNPSGGEWLHRQKRNLSSGNQAIFTWTSSLI
jgi:hypothetical protein